MIENGKTWKRAKYLKGEMGEGAKGSDANVLACLVGWKLPEGI